MTPKQQVEAFIVISAWSIYLFLAVVKIANIEGFVMLTTYIVKKYLDMMEQDNGNQDIKTIQTKTTSEVKAP